MWSSTARGLALFVVATTALIVAPIEFSLKRQIILAVVAMQAIGFFVLRKMDQGAKRRLASLNLEQTDYPIHASARLLVRGDTDMVVRASRRAIRALPNFKSMLIDTNGHLKARTGILRERIDVIVDEHSGFTQVRVESRPLLATVTVDWGKNFQNVVLVLRALAMEFSLVSVDPPEYEVALRGKSGSDESRAG
jgi:hypothetical protein